MDASELRQAFLNFFESKGHVVMDSSPLVPEGDKTLMFANAGMNQFKDVFTGQTPRPSPCATTSQKCVRAGGKHNDLENVGKTARHHTFFEMLGNFSFGDYFKEGAISHAWEFLTVVLKIDPDKLYITVHDSDDEAAELWTKVSGLREQDKRIIRMGDKENFWAMGETGPCGPCSEIHYDQGPEFGNGSEAGDMHNDEDRYLEIWNLVFMQYEQKADGSRLPLPKPSIDTGMGLERLCAVLGGHGSNYDTDLFTPLLKKVAELTSVPYHSDDGGVSHRVMADHAKATVFLISDGILPSNEGRGYVLRRIMRRAIRHAYLLGRKEPTMPELCEKVISMYGQAYPSLKSKWVRVRSIIEREELGFLRTIDKGIALFDSSKAEWREAGVVPGAAAFKLYDTFGFPLDLTEVMAEAEGLRVDAQGFEDGMAEQRKKAQAASMFKTSQLAGLKWQVLNHGEQEFSGYEDLGLSSSLLRVSVTAQGQHLVVPKHCSFYAESGGQVGDRGVVDIDGNTVAVMDVQLVEGYRTLVLDPEFEGKFDEASCLVQQVDGERRRLTAANHSCTHLLHKALKAVLGDHAEQRGSWVGPTHLRFDFPNNEAVTKAQLADVEARVNNMIQEDLEISTYTSSLDEAKAQGVTALFGEKYGDQVRVVNVAGVSLELCGGTHLARTGSAMAFVIRSESSVASGIRRIEAVTGPAALKSLFDNSIKLKEIGAQLQVQPQELGGRVAQLQKEHQQQRKEMARLKRELVMERLQQSLAELPSFADTPYLAEILDDVDAGDLRGCADALRAKHTELPILLACRGKNKAGVLISFPKSWVKSKGAHAGKTLKPLGKFIQGGGGGAPELAQAGGKNPDGLGEVLKGFKASLEELLT